MAGNGRIRRREVCALDMNFREKREQRWGQRRGKVLCNVILVSLSFLGILAWITVNFLTGNTFSSVS